MIDLRQLRYFVVVAEEEHVGRAAERLHISQSPLSRQIAQLEERLGLTLFERSQQRIRLTVDGQTFLAETRAFLTHANRLESLGRRLGRGEEGGLCIGYIENAMHSGVLPDALRTLRTARPGVHIALYSLNSAEQLEGLRQRSLDIALVSEPPVADDPDLDSARVLDDPMLLALPEQHPLAVLDELRPEHFPGQEWIAVQHRQNAGKQDDFVSACIKAGFNPDIRLEASEPLTALGLVAAGLGLTMIQRSLRHNAPQGVVLRELPWLFYTTPLWAAWHRINLRPLVATFREVLVNDTYSVMPSLATSTEAGNVPA
ncbi:LysR substrate-binding domain-containing protein [Pseudomonas gingeri]|uniref:LysR family transcriptional regulator n=1 Tax=Pseudomonas gingeri TaxID=117681 RepID=A0A7Y8CLC6_9PSED|nr:LysR substrate-binding domain-containing protein [Pseudomonas gingeri]NWA05415.1 LysR family transcriptional regulator [Pseudomonas gingeri]NWA17838.1 LysR family transcriptional regulator [Pseudomonas gingeri]NWA57802.1 LysR family transcriptional regulator [Pseudomonas gingeri]NWA98823.1 LysR family transcriptional regulator [Pseudomonas gingeri]NWB05949.1 LysR family transcriptional regulator [Pseudomonas gingeri]